MVVGLSAETKEKVDPSRAEATVPAGWSVLKAVPFHMP